MAVTFTHGANLQRLGQALREQLKAVGITLNLEMLDFSAAVDRVFAKKTFDLGVAFYCNGADPDIGVRRVYVSSNIGPYPFSNGASYRNPAIDRLFDEAAQLLDKPSRREKYIQIQRILADDVPYFWLVDTETLRAHRSTFTGFRLWTGAFAETVRPVQPADDDPGRQCRAVADAPRDSRGAGRRWCDRPHLPAHSPGARRSHHPAGGDGGSPSYYDAMRAKYGLDRPLLEQFVRYVRAVMSGDFGHSFIYQQPVMRVLLDHLPATVLLGGTALVLAVTIGFGASLICVIWRRRYLDAVSAPLHRSHSRPGLLDRAGLHSDCCGETGSVPRWRHRLGAGVARRIRVRRRCVLAFAAAGVHTVASICRRRPTSQSRKHARDAS